VPSPDLTTSGAPPATVVTVEGDGRHHAQRYAFRLRQGGVEVDELHYGSRIETADRMVADLARAIRRTWSDLGADEFRAGLSS